MSRTQSIFYVTNSKQTRSSLQIRQRHHISFPLKIQKISCSIVINPSTSIDTISRKNNIMIWFIQTVFCTEIVLLQKTGFFTCIIGLFPDNKHQLKNTTSSIKKTNEMSTQTKNIIKVISWSLMPTERIHIFRFFSWLNDR